MSDIKKGDQVQLKSGGPIMTVEALGNYEMEAGIENGAKCVWFQKETPQARVFDVKSLSIPNDL